MNLTQVSKLKASSSGEAVLLLDHRENYSIALVTTMRIVLFSASTSTIARMYAVGGLSYVTEELMSMGK